MAGKNDILSRRKRDLRADTLAAATRSDSKHVFLRPAQIAGRADNRPVDPEWAARLADSIEREGLGQPILVRPVEGERDLYELVAGQHRLEAYRILAERHPGDGRYAMVEAISRNGMDDDTARRLMYATNIPNANLDPAYRVRIFEELEGEVPAMREADPGLKGKRTSEIIAGMVEEAGGGRVSSRTIERRVRAAREEAEGRGAEGDLIGPWRAELSQTALPAATRSRISALDQEAQRRLLERWEDAGRRKDWLQVELELIGGGAEGVAERALSGISKGISQLRRAVAAGAGPEALARLREAVEALEEEAARNAAGPGSRREEVSEE